MKKILIIYPHWHPANLAGVQRPRLIGNYLKEFGWIPRVLTVKAQYFEEKPDYDFEKIFSDDFDVTRVDALPVNKKQKNAARGSKSNFWTLLYTIISLNYSIRLIGDNGLRAFFQLYKEGLKILKNEDIDFIWLPIPSFYNALLGRLLYNKTKIPYGIDYIDPWVRDLSNQNNWRAKISQWIAQCLEPIAIKKASLISGVSTLYYAPAIQRNFPTIANSLLKTQNSKLLKNPYTRKPITHVAMPYGFDPNDHKIKLDNIDFPWNTHYTKLKTHHSPLTTHNSSLTTPLSKIWLYAGAFLPNSHLLLDAFFRAISELRKDNLWDEDIHLWFIGTGQYPAKRITSYAKDHQINDIVFEKRERFPFLHVLNYLSAADTVMIIGSTEEHYTASKTYQSLLSERPVISVFHHKSSAVKVMEDCKADQFTVRYKPDMKKKDLVNFFKNMLIKRLSEKDWHPDLSALDRYSAKESAKKLVEAMERVVS